MKPLRPSSLGLTAAICLLALFSVVKLVTEKSAKASLGGDMEISRESTPASLDISAFMSIHSKATSHIRTLRAEAQTGGRDNPTTVPLLVKGIDKRYPLYGKLAYKEKKRKRVYNFYKRINAFGASATRASLNKLGLKPGKVFSVGDTKFLITAILEDEPDQPGEQADDHPRLLVSNKAFDALAAKTPSDKPVTHYYRMKLREPGKIAAVHEQFNTVFAERGWQMRDWRESVWPLFHRIGWVAVTVIMIVLIGMLLWVLPKTPPRGI